MLLNLPQPDRGLDADVQLVELPVDQVADAFGVPADEVADVGVTHPTFDEWSEHGGGEHRSEGDPLHQRLFTRSAFAFFFGR